MSYEEKLKRFINLYEDMEKKIAQDDLFNKEFAMLKARSLQWKNDGLYPADAGSVPINRKKNRFKDILPFEYTRVQLHLIEGVEHSDYINASYINGPSDEVEYIAAQGPLPHTVGDFWRMLWYHNIEVVVMACREVEMGKAKCEKYWTEQGETKEFGPISVTCTKEEKLTEDVMVRDLSAACEGEVQLIRQYHYQTWPDHDKPTSPEPLIEMLGLIRNYQKRKETPIVVHCSAGCGRTGTVISTDYIRTMINNKNLPTDLSIFGIVETMRKQRPAMVQTKNQYHFLYIAATSMAQMAITADVIPDKPTAPKPTFKEESSSAASSSKPDYINMEKLPNASNLKKDPIKQPDYTNITTALSDEQDPDDQMYGNREVILTAGDQPKPGDNLSNVPNRPPKAAPRTLSPIPPPIAPRTETALPKQPPKKPERPNTFSARDYETEDPLNSSTSSVTSPSKGKNISDILMDILDDIEEPEPATNFGGPGEYMMMDTDDADSGMPELPQRTEESKQLLTDAKDQVDNVYCEPAPVWNSSPSKPPKIDDNVSNSPPQQRKVIAGPAVSPATTPSKPSSSKSNILSSIFRNKGGQTASTRHKKITSAEISAPVGPLSKGPPPEGLALPGMSNRPAVPITSPVGRPPAVPLPTISVGPTPIGVSASLPRTSVGANNKYNFPGEIGFGKRLQKPKGPRKEPDSWSRWNFSFTL